MSKKRWLTFVSLFGSVCAGNAIFTMGMEVETMFWASQTPGVTIEAEELAAEITKTIPGVFDIVAFSETTVVSDTRQIGIYDFAELLNEEPFIDNNTNGTYDVGEPFTDVNGNGLWDDVRPVVDEPLPPENQNPSNPTAKFVGGIGRGDLTMQRGICLCTGYTRTADNTSKRPLDPIGFGSGVEGPNNAWDFPSNGQPGEASGEFNHAGDQDFGDHVIDDDDEDNFDAAVLEYKVRVTKPGFLRISLVFGSEEYPQYVDPDEHPFNDSVGVLVRRSNGNDPYRNIFTFRHTSNGVTFTSPLTLQDLDDCDKLFYENKLAPAADGDLTAFDFLKQPPFLFNPPDHYDHELNGFTKKFTRETGDDPSTQALEVIPLRGPLGSETSVDYTIKIVIADVADDFLNSAVFIPTNGVEFLPVLKADFNLDGKVNAADANIIGVNFNQSGKTFREGDANFDGIVNSADTAILNSVWGQTGGYKHYSADFDGDQDVDEDDLDIWYEHVFTTQKCASRFEGDANADGSVDGSDFNLWNDQQTN